MASQNEIVWKKDLTDIQSGLETLATKTKISIDLSSMNYDKVKKINVVALETAVNKLEEAFSGNCCRLTAARLVRDASPARPARVAKSVRPVKDAKRAKGVRSASIT